MVLVQVLGVIWTTYLVLAGLVQLMPKKCGLAIIFLEFHFVFWRFVNNFAPLMLWRILVLAMHGVCHR